MQETVKKNLHRVEPKRSGTEGRERLIDTLKLMFPLLLCLFLLSLTPVRAQDSSANGAFDRVITVGVKPGQMRYDVEEFSVPAGGRIKLIFDNSDGTLQHNLLILTPGDESFAIELAQEAWSMQNPIENEYVPDSDDVLFATTLLSPGEKETITFTAPDQPGDHPYVCTMPGHAMSMNGMMHVQAPDTPDKDGGSGEQKTSGGPPDKLALENVTYRYYEGKWNNLPTFDDLEPVDGGEIQNGIVSLAPKQREKNYGIVFEGKLKLPTDGTYQFYVASDDGTRLIIDGKTVVENDGTHPVQTESGGTSMVAGEHDVRLEFFQAQGGAGLQMAAVTPGGTQINFSRETGAIGDLTSFRMTPSSGPKVFRVRLPDAPPRSVAVGLPSRLHYCFDPTEGYVRYAWSGNFLNVGPERGDGKGRGGQVCKILGERFNLGMAEHGQPLRFGTPDRKPEFSFRGYIRHGDAPPTMMYTLDGVNVRLQVHSMEGKRGVELRYRFKNVPAENMFFRVDRSVVDVSTSKGEWKNDSTLALPGTKKLRITLVPTD